jgi:hypothetical protein
MDSQNVAGPTTRAPRTRSDGFLTTFWGLSCGPARRSILSDAS